MNEKPTPIVLSAENISLSFGELNILNNVSLSIHSGERIAIIGRNGSGKSSLMKIISGIDMPDKGEINVSKSTKISYLPQEIFADKTSTVIDYIYQGASHITELIKKYEDKKTSLAEKGKLDDLINHYDGWTLENRIEKVMQMVSTPSKTAMMHMLSGGEKRRVALAATIVSSPDLLILDEPTNHLDSESIEWLEKYIIAFRGTVIFVTHDRYFLDNIATRTIEVMNGALYSYACNYSEYLLEKANRMKIEEITEQKRQSFIRRELKWVRSSPKARTTKSQSRLNRFYEIYDALPPEKELDIDLVIPPAKQLSDKVVEFNQTSFAYKDKYIFENFSFRISPGMKIGIVGKNGSGKTTLVKLITQDLQPTSGTVELAGTVNINYIDQERVKIDESKTVYEEIGEGGDFVYIGDEKVSTWTYLKRFLFEDYRIRTKISELSGGEKARLLLAKILKKGGNFLILDEPTNDLDLQTLRLLEEALTFFKGCVIVVSHDRYFLDRMCGNILEVESGAVRHFVGNYSYYKEQKNALLLKNKESQKLNENKKENFKFEPPRKLTWKEERELEVMEEKILETETLISEIELAFANSDFYKKYSEKIEEITKNLDDAKKSLVELYKRWDFLEGIKSASMNKI